MNIGVAIIACVLLAQLVSVRADAAPGSPFKSRPPNVVIILADDLGYGDLGVYGSKTIATPRIDRLAAEGMRFTDAYVPSPLCTPSRAALLTGSYPRRIGLDRGVLRPDARTGLHPDERTLPELLKARGYVTGAVGKWHLGALPPFRPTRQGFDEYFGVLHNLDKWEAKHFEKEGGVPFVRGEAVVERPATPDVVVQRYTEEAVRFINAHKDRPFFLYLAHTMPHEPLGASAPFRSKSKGGLYGDAVEELDASTGKIVDTIVQLGLARDTLVILTSDNGPENGHGSAGPLRGRKHTTFEGGVRVPFIAWGPGRIPRGRVQREVVTTMDLYATFARLVGASVPSDRPIDGRDIWPLLTGRRGARTPHAAFFYRKGNGALEGVRSGRWKLHRATKTGSPALYDLVKDPAEANDRSRSHPEVVRRLERLMEAHEALMSAEARPVGKL